MNSLSPRFAVARGILVAAFGAVAVLAACQTPLPTDADVARMDASSAERAARQLAVIGSGDSLAFYVNGVAVSEQKAKSIVTAQIVSVEVSKDPATGAKRVDIGTLARKRESGALAAASDSTREHREFTGLIFINGVLSTAAAMKSLDPKSIESIEVLKGKAAAQQFSDPAAANGVITITTKK